MNPNEARVAIIEEIANMLVELSLEGGAEDDVATLTDAMLDAADLIADYIGLDVVEVLEPKVFAVRVDLNGPDETAV
jgi:hypothetical protein